MSVPSKRKPQRIPVSQIHSQAKSCVIRLFMQSNHHSRMNMEAACKDFPMVGTQMRGWKS